MEVIVLASGSSGNAALVRSGSTQVLVDAGLSCRQLCLRLAAVGVPNPSVLDGIVLTHEHGDHMSAVRLMTKKFDVPVYANRNTAAAMSMDGRAADLAWRFFSTGAEFSVGGLMIESFAVPHDASEPVGFCVRNTAEAFGFLTDLGHTTAALAERLREVSGLLIEANYDDALLAADLKRPWSIKQRIQSRHGHLSNDEAARFVSQLAGGRLRNVIVGHLSRDCNSPESADACFARYLGGPGGAMRVTCVHQDAPAFHVDV